MMNIDHETIAIIGLGYVGLPLAVAFGRKREVVGFDINAGRIAQLAAGVDRTLETDAEDLASAQHLRFTSNEEDLRALQRLHRHGAHSDRPGQPPRPRPLARGQRR